MNMMKDSRKGKQPFHPNSTARFMKNDEASIASDTSSLGSKMQLPHAFRLQNSIVNKKSSKPAQVFPETARSSSCSREMLRQEAKVQRLVVQAKQRQSGSSFSYGMHDPAISSAQAMSVTLPAACYHHKKNHKSSNKSGFGFGRASGLADTTQPSSWRQPSDGGLRENPWTSSSANTFVREEQRRQRNHECYLDALPESEEEGIEANSPRRKSWGKAYRRFFSCHFNPIADRRCRAQTV